MKILYSQPSYLVTTTSIQTTFAAAAATTTGKAVIFGQLLLIVEVPVKKEGETIYVCSEDKKH
jgi:hypothetical protein